MKKIFVILLMIAAVSALIGCMQEGKSVRVTGTSETTFEGVHIDILSIKQENDNLTLEVQWENQTAHEVLYGESFRLLRQNGEEWVECESKENTAFHAIGYGLNPHSEITKEYQLGWIYDVLKPGVYRFETECYVYDNHYGTECTLWAEFLVEEQQAAANRDIQFDASAFRTDGALDGETFPQVTLINSLDALRAYCERQRGLHGFADLSEDYNEKFFESRFLLMALLGEGSGSIRHKVTQVQAGDGAVNVHISRTVPEAITCDLIPWHIVIELEREHLAECGGDLRMYVDGKLAWDNTPVQPNISWAEGEYRQPPQLQLIYDGGEMPAMLGTYSWMFAQGDGTWGAVCADSLHPLQCEGTLEMILTEEPLLKLAFKKDPDSLTVRCWPDSRWGSPQAEPKSVDVSDGTIMLKDGGHIYEVVASWEDDGSNCYGTAHYYFYAALATPHAHMPISGGELQAPSGYCGNTQTTVFLPGENFTFDGTNSVHLTDVLRNLDFSEGKTCRCMAEYRVDTEFGSGYEISLERSFVRFQGGQAELTVEQVGMLQPIFDWIQEQVKER